MYLRWPGSGAVLYFRYIGHLDNVFYGMLEKLWWDPLWYASSSGKGQQGLDWP